MNAKIKTSKTKTQVSVTAKFANGTELKVRLSMANDRINVLPGSEDLVPEASQLLRSKGPKLQALISSLHKNTSPSAIIDRAEAALQGVSNLSDAFDRLIAM